MSTALTSPFGMPPPVLFPGAGSEPYRGGLGSAVIGGPALSALLTPLVLPPMLTVFTTRPTCRALVHKP